MALTITINQSLADELQAQATAEKLTVEEFAVKVLSHVMAERATHSETFRKKNQRRVDLIRKNSRGGLTEPEKRELLLLQQEVDQALEHLDRPLLDQLSRMEQAVNRLSSDG